MMSTIKNIEVKGPRLYLIGGLMSLLTLLLFAGCSKVRGGASPESISEPAISLRLTGVNEPGNPETTVQMVRLIIADDYNGEVLYNDKLTWRSKSQEAPVGGEHSDPIKWTHGAGNYDFYLIANEQSLTQENLTKLTDGLYNISNLEALGSVVFQANEIKTLDQTNKPLLSTAVLKSQQVRADKPKDNPEVITATLVRNLSKISVEVYRKKKAQGEVNHAVIEKMQLVHVSSNYHLFFTPQLYNGNALLASEEFGGNITSYNPVDMSEPLFSSREYYLSEYLFGVNESVKKPTSLKIWYRPSNASTITNTIEFPVDVQGLYKYRTDVLKYIGHGATSLNDVSEHSVMRGIHYKIRIDITDEKIEPVINIKITPWDLVEQEVTHTDYNLNATKEEVMLNYPKGSSNSLMILSNIKDRRALKWRVVDGDASWLSITPNVVQEVQLDGIDKQYTFQAISENSGGEPRSVVIEFTALPYQHPVRITVTQRPRQVMLNRRYVSFVGEGGEATIKVDNYGYGWDASIVSNVSTMAHHSNWLTLQKVNGTDNKQQLKVSVQSTKDYDLMRHAVIKVYDGSKHASYIWVEQGNYKPVTVNGNVWLDRNLGSLHSPRDRNAWFPGGEITNRERAKRNGYFYQYGRVPDGSHILGIDLVRGTIRPSLASTEISYTPLDLQLRPDGFPLKWDDLGNEKITGEPSCDEQYGKFISQESSWFTPTGASISKPRWTKPDGSKNAGVDPCPEGYRVPTLQEFNTLSTSLPVAASCGYWVAAKDENNLPMDLYFPLSGYRETSGYFNPQNWFYINTIEARYATSSLYGNAVSVFYFRNGLVGSKQVPLTTGLVVRCIKDE